MLTDLYHITRSERSGETLTASASLNAAHPLFGGHFPGQPVLPGVCQLALIKDLLQRHTGKKWVLRRADQVKFMAPIDPRRTPELHISLQLAKADDLQVVQAVISAGEIVFLKSKVRFADA